jgi:hypothetical protein
MNQLKVKATNETVDLISSSVSIDIEQFVWSFNAEVATKALLQKLIPPANLGQNYIPVAFTLGAETWELIIEDTNCNDSDFSYSVTGKSKTIILAEPYAQEVTKTWLNTTAQAICSELCTDYGITLDWQILDWSIAYYAVDKRYPIDIISELVRDIGAKLQTTPTGVLTAVYYPALSPSDLAAATALYSIDTLRTVFDRGEKFINRKNYDCVFVTKDSSLLDAPSISLEEITADENTRFLNVYPNPLVSESELNLHHASGNHAVLTYEGTFTERQIDDVLIEAGEGKLSKQFTSLVNVKWQQTEVGALTIAENGKISCSGGGMGLATITYVTSYLRYTLTKTGSIAKTLVMSDELPPPVLTTGNDPMPPIVVKTLSTQAALTARANAELWNQFDTNEYSLTVPYTGSPLLCGKITKVNIIRESLGFNGWIKSVAIDSTGDVNVTIEAPAGISF